MTAHRLDTKQYNYNNQDPKTRYTTEQEPPYSTKR
jgi:hypothetical protein